MNPEELKRIVSKKYGEIARQSKQQAPDSCCCQSTDCPPTAKYSVFSEPYEKLEGYDPESDLKLGCGIPTQYADINKGDAVLDLGSGAGNDCFVAHALVGENGRVTGLDFTDEMLLKAERILKNLGYQNVSFVKGDIERIPLPDNEYDVVLSNCVLNLVPDKHRAFSEIYRVLKPDGHFCISDVVLRGMLPEKLRKDAEMYAGCVAGAIDMDRYLEIIRQAGFKKIRIHKQKDIALPVELLSKYVTGDELKKFKEGKTGIYSITLSGHK